MTNKEIMDGIWNAKNAAELSAHLDEFEAALEDDACEYSGEFADYIEASIAEIQQNNFKRVFH